MGGPKPDHVRRVLCDRCDGTGDGVARSECRGEGVSNWINWITWMASLLEATQEPSDLPECLRGYTQYVYMHTHSLACTCTQMHVQTLNMST